MRDNIRDRLFTSTLFFEEIEYRLAGHFVQSPNDSKRFVACPRTLRLHVAQRPTCRCLKAEQTSCSKASTCSGGNPNKRRKANLYLRRLPRRWDVSFSETPSIFWKNRHLSNVAGESSGSNQTCSRVENDCGKRVALIQLDVSRLSDGVGPSFIAFSSDAKRCIVCSGRCLRCVVFSKKSRA